MNDTTRRFLTAVVDRVPAGGEIVELRLFPAIRQGGIESAVAVVAVQLPDVVPTDPAQVSVTDGDVEAPGGTTGADVEVMAGPATDHADRATVDAIPTAVIDLVDTDVAVEDEEGSDGDDHPVPVSFIPMADTTGEHEVGEALDEEVTEIVVAAERDAGTPDLVRSPELESPYADVFSPMLDGGRPIPSVHGDTAGQDVADRSPFIGESAIRLDDILALPSPNGADATDVADAGEEVVSPAVPRQRYAILTASYRLTIKGPDRGRWEVDITHEADAPLETLERVARGVAKRAGEAFDPDHFSGESLRAALEAPVWATTP